MTTGPCLLGFTGSQKATLTKKEKGGWTEEQAQTQGIKTNLSQYIDPSTRPIPTVSLFPLDFFYSVVYSVVEPMTALFWH
jgi:hypothetical protein